MRIKFVIVSTLVFMGACNQNLSDAQKFAIANPGDVFGALAKAESGINVGCSTLRENYNVAKNLAAAKSASITERSLPGRYESVLKRYKC